MKNTCIVPVRLSEEWVRKLLYVSEKEGRTPNNQFLFMLQSNIRYFERTKGKIPASELEKLDISDYTQENQPSTSSPS